MAVAVQTLTKSQVMSRSLRVTGQSVSAQTREFLDHGLDKIAQLGYWGFLYKTTTHQTVNAQQSVLFSASEFPSAALTDYHKGLSISSAASPFRLTQLSKEEFNAVADGETGNPTHFALEKGSPGSEKLWLFPTPVTGTLPLLTLNYYKIILHPDSDTDNMQTDVGLPSGFNTVLEDWIRAETLWVENDTNAQVFEAKFLRGVASLIIENDDFFNESQSRVDRSSLIEKIASLFPTTGTQ
jgi:hypothetical protein